MSEIFATYAEKMYGKVCQKQQRNLKEGGGGVSRPPTQGRSLSHTDILDSISLDVELQVFLKLIYQTTEENQAIYTSHRYKPGG